MRTFTPPPKVRHFPTPKQPVYVSIPKVVGK